MSNQLLSYPKALPLSDWSNMASGLSAQAGEDVEPSPFTVLDCFDQSIRQSGRLLIETEGALVLMEADGRLLRQPAARKGNFVADLADGPVKHHLSDMSPLRCLLDLGQGELVKDQLRLVDDEEKTHLRVDVLRFSKDNKTVSLMALTPVRGYDKAQKQVTKGLLTAGASVATPGQIQSVLFPDLVPYVAKPKLSFAPETTAVAAANQIIAAYLSVARQNEPGTIADFDTEFLHDYRVALRKIRSVLSLFKGVYGDAATAELKQRFSDLMAPTGALRDLDVYLLEQDYYFDMLPENLHEGLRLMFETFATDRKDALTTVTKRLKSVAYNREMAELQVMFETPGEIVQGPQGGLTVGDYAKRLIWKRYRKVCKTAAKIDDKTPDEEVHELRISCKKLRYLIEFFAPQFDGAEIKAILKPLKKLQDNLGLFNDFSVQQESLQALISSGRLKGQTALKAAQSIGALISILHGRQLEERARVVQSFAGFDSQGTRERFRTLFHEKGAQS